jgi:isocitrate dehydrogenase (NAD+)
MARVSSPHAWRCRKLADGLFLECCREAAKKYPSIKYEEMIIDNAMLQMALNPTRFDVMVMPNLYGDIASGA